VDLLATTAPLIHIPTAPFSGPAGSAQTSMSKHTALPAHGLHQRLMHSPIGVRDH